MPDDMPEDLEDLISRLLCKDPKVRLGAKGAEEVKQHAFFKDVNWEAVVNKEVTPPYLPMLSSNDDVSHFHKVSNINKNNLLTMINRLMLMSQYMRHLFLKISSWMIPRMISLHFHI